MSSDDNAKLSPNASPKIMEMKTKRARRINNWPVFIVFVVGAVIALTLGLVVVSRSSKAKAEIGKTTVKSSEAHAKELIALANEAANRSASPALPSPEASTQPKDEPPQSPKTDDAPKVQFSDKIPTDLQ